MLNLLFLSILVLDASPLSVSTGKPGCLYILMLLQFVSEKEWVVNKEMYGCVKKIVVDGVVYEVRRCGLVLVTRLKCGWHYVRESQRDHVTWMSHTEQWTVPSMICH